MMRQLDDGSYRVDVALKDRPSTNIWQWMNTSDLTKFPIWGDMHPSLEIGWGKILVNGSTALSLSLYLPPQQDMRDSRHFKIAYGIKRGVLAVVPVFMRIDNGRLLVDTHLRADIMEPFLGCTYYIKAVGLISPRAVPPYYLVEDEGPVLAARPFSPSMFKYLEAKNG